MDDGRIGRDRSERGPAGRGRSARGNGLVGYSRGDDYLVESGVHLAATAADARGYTNAALNLRHFLANSGEPLVVDPADIAGDVEVFEEEIDNLLDSELDAAVAQALAQPGVPTPFVSDWMPISFQSDRDWFLALGDASFSVTGTAVYPESPGDPVVVQYQVHVYDYYTWDDGKSTNIGGASISDEVLQNLHTAGLAQEYYVHGSTETVTIELGEPPAEGEPPADPSAPEDLDVPADDGRDGSRTDPTRERPNDEDRVPEGRA